MKLRLFAVDIKPDETIEVSFDTLVPATDLEWVKRNLGKTVELEDLQAMFDN